jgi:hypothetical protein
LWPVQTLTLLDRHVTIVAVGPCSSNQALMRLQQLLLPAWAHSPQHL